jgi:hypothetical protein
MPEPQRVLVIYSFKVGSFLLAKSIKMLSTPRSAPTKCFKNGDVFINSIVLII